MLKVLKFFFKSSWKQIFIISVVSMIAAGLNVLSLRYLKHIVDATGRERLLNLLLVIAFVVCALIISLLLEKYSTWFFEHRLARYREELSRRILQVDYQRIRKKLTRLAPVLMVEINELNDFGKLIPAFVSSMMQIIAIMGYLLYLSPKLSLIVFVLLLLVLGLTFMVLPMVKRLKDKRSKTRYHMYTMLELMNIGFKDLIMNRSHGKSYVEKSIRPPSLETAKYNGQIHILKVGVEQSINGLLIISFGVVLILYLNWVQDKTEVAVQFMALLLFMLPSFVRVIDFFNQSKNAENALDQISSLDVELDSEHKVINQEVDYRGKAGQSLIRLNEITYAYSTSEHGFSLGPINLEIIENEITIISGGNGSGKTTLFNLIAGIYQSKSGELIFQGRKIHNENIRAYRDLFSTYFTDSPVFDDLTYIPEENIEKGKGFIELLGLEGKTSISATTIAETNLSFGQRGRLNLLRLLLEDRPVYLFDEWAANQDVYFKEKFYTEIIPYLKRKGKTIILISHDDRYYHIADKIISLRNGQVDKVKVVK